jgi:hypothetical protein
VSLTNFPVIYFRNKGINPIKFLSLVSSKHDSDTVRMQEMASIFFFNFLEILTFHLNIFLNILLMYSLHWVQSNVYFFFHFPQEVVSEVFTPNEGYQ